MSLFDPVITLGEIIGIAIILAMGTGGWVIRQWRRGHPFTVEFSEEAYNFKASQGGFVRGPRKVTKRLILPIGISESLIRIRPRGATHFERINIRFIIRGKWRFWHRTDADPNLVHVTGLRDVVYSTEGDVWGRSYFEADPDTVGGYDGVYNPGLHVREKEWVWLCVHANASTRWKGYLSFEGTHDERRAWGQIRATVNPELAPGTEERKCVIA